TACHTYITSLLRLRPPPPATLFPYTTLFRSSAPWRNRAGRTPHHGNSLAAYSRAANVTSGAARMPDTTATPAPPAAITSLTSCRSEEHTSELQSRENLVCRLLLEKKKTYDIK